MVTWRTNTPHLEAFLEEALPLFQEAFDLFQFSEEALCFKAVPQAHAQKMFKLLPPV